ncbi:MAG: methanethiol S-methyltransferase [Candidatus Solibacter sp.]
MKRIAVFTYGLLCYAIFLVSLLYSVGFLGNILPNSIDSTASGSALGALAIDAGLLALFAVQHSVMARPWFKRAWTRVVPEPVERSTYVLLSSLALIFLFREWQPVGGVVWDLQGGPGETLLYALFAVGLLIVLVSTFLINHFDLFGMRQVTLYLMGREYTHLEFRTPFFYRFVRHPLYVGWVLTFWSAPLMTAAHLFFAVMTTTYILIAIQFEESDLVAIHGERYRNYRKQVPMIVPTLTPNVTPDTATRPRKIAAA